MKQKIIFLTWASWVGKTTITNELKKSLENTKWVVFSSFDDEKKIPEEKEVMEKWWSWESWQEQTSLEYIKNITEKNKNAVLLILDRQANLDFIEKWFEEINYKNYKIVLVTCSVDKMKKRLEKRKQPELFNENMINWIKFLEKQAEEKWVKILDTSEISVKESILEIKKLIK